jgi:hypothetical protein
VAAERGAAVPLTAAAAADPREPGWVVAPDAAALAATGGAVMALLEVPPPPADAADAAAAIAGFDLLATAYRPAAVCPPGTAGAAGAGGFRAGPAPLADLRGAPAALGLLDNTTATAPFRAALLRDGACVACAPGSASPASAASACAACAPGRAQPVAGAEACAACPAGQFQPAAGTTACAACPPGTPSTASPGADAATACFGAAVWAERAAVVGLSLAVTVAWGLAPAGAAGVRDVVALFREPDRGPPRQLAWAFTSAAALVPLHPLGSPPTTGRRGAGSRRGCGIGPQHQS